MSLFGAKVKYIITFDIRSTGFLYARKHMFEKKFVPIFFFFNIPHGLVVRISGFHPGGPGSIPGAGTLTKIDVVKVGASGVHFVPYFCM